MGNQCSKQTRVPHTRKFQVMVREFVRGKRSKRERVTARQVLDLFVENKMVEVPTDVEGRMEKVAFQSAYRSTRRWLEANRYRRVKWTGNLVMK